MHLDHVKTLMDVSNRKHLFGKLDPVFTGELRLFCLCLLYKVLIHPKKVGHHLTGLGSLDGYITDTVECD